MTIRSFEPGDDAAQVSIYNEAAAELPKFKPATLDEVRRRGRDPAFDRSTYFLALRDGRPVGYASFQANGRVSYPWCRKGHEDRAGPLFERVLAELRRRGLPRAFAAYRADWPAQKEFFLAQGFRPAREMVNYALDLAEMPTPSARPSNAVSPLTPADLPAALALGQGVVRARDEAELGRHLFENPYFPPDSVLALRGAKGEVRAVGVLVVNAGYADPRQTDPAMPCFRLGAFGTEGLTTKRVNGLFSFVAADKTDLKPLGLDLLGYAAFRLRDTDVETFGAQAPSDAPHLARFYKEYFRRQGAFPVFEKAT
jgi:hypothetical protein